MVATLALLSRLGWWLTFRATLCRRLRVFAFLRGRGRYWIDPNCRVHVLLLMVATLVHLSRLGWWVTFRATLCRRLRVSAFLRG